VFGVCWPLLGSRERPANRILYDDSNRRAFALDQPLGFVAALRMLLDGWMRNESAEGSGSPRAWREN
jgi:hypothetical protein